MDSNEPPLKKIKIDNAINVDPSKDNDLKGLPVKDISDDEQLLPKIANRYQLIKLLDEPTQTYDALDLLEHRFYTARRLEKPRHMKRLRLALRLSMGIEYSEENQRLSNLLIPTRTRFHLFKEKLLDQPSPRLYYYWFEPPNHGSLHAYVIERRKLPESLTKEYFRQICKLVEFCHERGVIIRDLKLRKFVFADRDRLTIKLDDLDETAVYPEKKCDPNDMLLDWNKFDENDDRLCDRHGCPAYVSPEILDLSKKWYSGKPSDVWSLGVLLYVILVGRYPFYDVTPAGLFSKIRQARIHLADQDGVRLVARTLIRSMLRRNPLDRPTIKEVLSHPWINPKSYLFKGFDHDECIFWRRQPIPNTAIISTSNVSTSTVSTSNVSTSTVSTSNVSTSEPIVINIPISNPSLSIPNAIDSIVDRSIRTPYDLRQVERVVYSK